MRVAVSVANLWVAADSPRPVDERAVADHPDLPSWLADLDAHPGEDDHGDGRLGLHRRLHTQLVAGEPVVVIGPPDVTDTDGTLDRPGPDGWVEVYAPWQPSRLDPRGYPGWVRRAHLTPDDGSRAASVLPEPEAVPAVDADHPLLDLARRHLGLPYLWGGTTPAGFDCSGLVHWSMRQLARVVPRDAHDQQDAFAPVPRGAVRPGDLYFFTHPGQDEAHHVGVVTTAGHMVHAPETGAGVVEEALDERRRATLSGAGRIDLGG